MKKFFITVVLFLCFIQNGFCREYSGFDEVFMNDIYYSRLKDNIIKYQKATKLYKVNDLTNVYCLEPWLYIGQNEIYNAYDSNHFKYLNISKELWDRLSLIAYYGYGYNNHLDNKWIAITQMLLWQNADKTVNSYFTDGLNGPKIDIYVDEINEINNLVNNHNVKPSFDNEIYTVNLNDEFIIYDDNKVLDLYDLDNETIFKEDGSEIKIKANNELILKKEKNKIKIKTDKVGQYTINLVKKDKIYNHKPIVYINNNYQNILEVGSFEPINSKFKVNIVGGVITINKYDSETKNSNSISDGILSGAKYGIYKDDKLVDEVIINDSVGVSKVLPYGKYKIKELEASVGYELDNNIYDIEINSENNIITVYENIQKYNLNIFKGYTVNNTSKIYKAENVEFEIYYKDKLYKKVKTDKDGFLSVQLPYGKYEIHQVNKTEDYEIIDDFKVDMNKDIEKIIYNNITKSKVKINKKDYENKEYVKNSNAEFIIKNLDTNESKNYKVNEEGYVYTEYLKKGNYELIEIDKYMERYLYNPNSIKFKINENLKFKEDENGFYIEIDFYNEKVKGELDLIMTNEITNDYLTYEEIYVNDYYLELRSNEDGIYKKDELISSLVTNEGKINIKNLNLGKYYIYDPLTKERYEFELKYVDQYTKIVKEEIIINYYLKKGNLKVKKMDKDTKEVLSNIEFELYDENDNLVKKLITNKDGLIELNNLKQGKYYLKEIKTLDDYILNEEKIIIELNEDIYLEIYNERIKKEEVIISKPNEEIKEEIKNAEIKEEIQEATKEETKEEIKEDIKKEEIIEETIKKEPVVEIIKKEEINNNILGMGNVINKDEEIIETIKVPDTYKNKYNFYILILLLVIYVKKYF